MNLIIPYEATRPALAHYVEHLVYLSVIRGKFDGTDPDDNATTNKSAITYTLNGPISQLPAILHVLAGVFAPLDLSTRAADEERDIVMREYDLDHDSGMEEEATDALNTFLFEGNGMSVSVLGSRGDIAALTLADAQRFHRDTHRPERAMLLVSGGVSTDDVAGLLATTGFPQFGSRGAMKPVQITMSPPAEREVAYPRQGTMRAMVWNKLVALPEPVPFDRLDAICSSLADLLESGLPGGLGKPLYYDHLVVREFGVSITAIDERHVEIFVYAEPTEQVSFAALRSALETALQRSADGIPPASFERIRKRILAEWPEHDSSVSPRWIAGYMLRRLKLQRLPLGNVALREIDTQITLADADWLLKHIATTPGRLAVARLGQDRQQ